MFKTISAQLYSSFRVAIISMIIIIINQSFSMKELSLYSENFFENEFNTLSLLVNKIDVQNTNNLYIYENFKEYEKYFKQMSELFIKICLKV